MKKVLLIAALMLSGIILYAAPVSMTNASVVATKFYQHIAKTDVNDFSISNQFETKYNGVNTYYTFNFASGGFVMVSADDAVKPIIGYSDEGSIIQNNIPPNASNFFESQSKEIVNIITANLSNKDTKLEWDNIRNSSSVKSIDALVGPLLGTGSNAIKWDQASPYSNDCPSGTVTGCVATAMAQIMRFWNWPTTGVGSHTYTTLNYGSQTANFGATTYDWANMPVTYSGGSTSAQNAAVATLMFHAGVSVNMDYETAAAGGSGAYDGNVPPALVDYFRYQPTAEVKARSSFGTDALWLLMIEEELNEGRPLALSGDNNGTAGTGHFWVCDGYNTTLNTCHMNWGWSGSSNGYYNLTALNPTGENFSSDRAAVVRITPLSSLMPIADFTVSNTIPAIAAPVSFTDASLNTPTSWLWTFDGGTPATSNVQNPTGVTFATNGYHLVSLKVTNATGSDIKTKERYIKVGGAPTLWTKQNSGFSATSRGIDQIAIIDANTVWAKAYNGVNPVGYIREFTRTNDGGTTWTPGTIDFTGSSSYGAANLQVFDYNTAYACMFPVSGNGGTIVKTIDGGVTWTTQPSADFTTSWADFVHFFDANNGVCVGDPTTTTGTEFWIYTTNNGGATWNHVAGSNIPNCLTGETAIVNEYDAVGNTIWFTSTKGRCYKSTDMGATWTVSTTGFSGSYQMKFKDANVGIAVQDTIPYALKKTINGGSTWTTLTPTGFYVKRAQLAFIPGTTSTWVDVVSNPSNGSSASLDDGATFVNIDTGSVQFTSVAFMDINTGWAGSFNQSATDDGIYKWNPSVLTPTGIKNATANTIAVYPVPSTGIVNISVGKIEDTNMTITVYNAIGSQVMSEQVKTISNDILQVDLSNKDRGLYFISITNGGKTTTKKITIQ